MEEPSATVQRSAHRHSDAHLPSGTRGSPPSAWRAGEGVGRPRGGSNRLDIDTPTRNKERHGGGRGQGPTASCGPRPRRLRAWLPAVPQFRPPLLFRILSIRHADVVVCEPPPTTGAVVRIACSIRRLPDVYFAADIWSDAAGTTGAPSPIVRGVQSIERAAIRGAADVLSVSPGVTSRLTRWVPTSQVTEVGHGVDTTIYNPSGRQQTLGGPYLVYAGTASEVHGARIFAEAFRGVLETHPDARLVYLGQGSDYPVLREIASTLSEGCMLVMGRKSPEETASWLRGSVCALASLMPGSGYEYAIPTKMYAALACGVPVVYAGPGPNRDLVEAFGLGLTADYDVASVTTAMVKALERPDTGPELSNELNAWAESHASSDLAARLAADGIWGAGPSASRRQS